MNSTVVECDECHYEFNYAYSPDGFFYDGFPKIVRCPECGVGSNIESSQLRNAPNTSSHSQHTGSKTGIKIWLAMLGPIIILEIAAFLSMPLLRISFLFYVPGIAIVAVAAWSIAAGSSVLISKYLARAKVVLQDPLK